MEPGIFDGLNALTGLGLSGNDLTTLEPGIFDGLNALTGLTLAENDLTTLEPSTFDGLNALTWLTLADNKLTTLEPGIFDGLSSLTFLELQYNRVRLPITIHWKGLGKTASRPRHTPAHLSLLSYRSKLQTAVSSAKQATSRSPPA